MEALWASKWLRPGENTIELREAVDTEAVRDTIAKTLEIAKIAGIKRSLPGPQKCRAED